MSVVVHDTHGFVLDARALIDQGYSRCVRWTENLKSYVKCRFKSQYFQLLKSYYNTSISSAVDKGKTDIFQEADLPRKVKRRKRKHSDLNQGEHDMQAFHEKIRTVILEGTKSLLDAARCVGYLNGSVTDTVTEPLPLQECNLAALCEMAKDLPVVDGHQDKCVQLLDPEEGCTSHLDLFSQVTENKSDWATVVTLMGQEYVIPPHAAFLLSDLTRIQPLVSYGQRFDLIVLDPPWENKSIKRSRRYSSLPSSQLKRLPIPLLASPNCLVVTWVTNRPSHLQFVYDELYPHWDVEVVAEWFWVKVTTSGHFVFPLDSPHKKPYEVLVLGRYQSLSNDSPSSSETLAAPVDNNRVIVSVPSALHSHKPSLSEVLKPYVGANSKCLELFARNLQPGWTSWGNEVLKLQQTSYFTLNLLDDYAAIPEGEDAETPGKASPPTIT
ncbi:N(6)-adenine-specific DNA methyltransferase METTL4 [Thalassophryne amazonica]|uniref:N(6)-adenine-specific DNA methyltransferase METTL4 n=1 Tax=Thalassophryne amazonica TaxID=390379 RepID=UPI001470FA36|nr:N(6)-adenine-specific DNA methyltransferase METTL4 [Thalassophryne amazonica]